MEKENNSSVLPEASPVKKKSFLNDKLLPFMGKVGNQRHLAAIRDSFQTILPLIIAGAIGLLFTTIVFGGYGSENVSLLGAIFMMGHWDQVQALPDGVSIGTLPEWQEGAWLEISNFGVQLASPIKQVTFDMMSIYIAFLMGYYLGISRGTSSPIMSGFVALATFGIFINFSGYFIDAKGLIAAIIGGLVGAEVFIAFSKMRALEIRLPDGVPPSVGKSFAVLIPVVMTLFIWSLFNTIIWWIAGNNDLQVTAGTVATLSLFDGADLAAGGNGVADITALFTNTLDTAIADNVVTDAGLIAAAEEAGNLLEAWLLIATNADSIVATPEANASYMFFEQLEAATVGVSDEAFNLAIDQVLINNSGGTITWAMIEDNWNETLIDFAGDANTDAQASSIVVLTWQKVTVDTPKFGFSALVYLLVQVPFMNMMSSGGGFFIVMVYVFLVSFFWFFGIHGPNITSGIFDPIWYGILATNASLVAQMGTTELATEYMGIYAKPFFDAFLTIGGSGCTMGLLFATFIFSRRREMKEISKYALPAGIFRINEPVIFGFPLVLNFRYVVPFVIAPMVSISIAALAVQTGFMFPSYIAFPWTTPFIVAGLFANGFQMPLHTMAVIITCWISAFAIWFPFVLIDNTLEDKKRQREGLGSAVEKAHWELKDNFNQSELTLKEGLKAQEISKAEFDAYNAQLQQDKQELLTISNVALQAWMLQDKLEYQERRQEEAKEYKEMRAAMKEQQKLDAEEARKAKAESKNK